MRIKMLFTTVIVLLMAIHFNSYAQSEKHGSKARKETLPQAVVVSGYVTEWLVNSKKDVYDGFYLRTIDEKLMVMFPVHMGSELRQAIRIGKTIAVNGIETKDTLGVKKINLASVTIDGKTIQVDPSILAGATPANEIINGTAKIRELQKNVDGKVTGYILDNKTILRLAPNIGNELVRLLVAGATISYSGIKSDSGSGGDAWASYTIINCQTITIKGKQYLTN
jgi:hypothetical protein